MAMYRHFPIPSPKLTKRRTFPKFIKLWRCPPLRLSLRFQILVQPIQFRRPRGEKITSLHPEDPKMDKLNFDMTSEDIIKKGLLENAYTSANRPRRSGPLGPEACQVLRFKDPGLHNASGFIVCFNLFETVTFGIPRETHIESLHKKR